MHYRIEPRTAWVEATAVLEGRHEGAPVEVDVTALLGRTRRATAAGPAEASTVTVLSVTDGDGDDLEDGLFDLYADRITEAALEAASLL